MDSIRHYFERVAPLKNEEWDLLRAKLIRREYPKKAMILKAGETENLISFVETGVVRFFIQNDNDERTFAVIFQNELLSAYDSFLTRSPSSYYAQAITKTVLWSFTYSDLQELYRQAPISNVIGRIACEELYLKKAKRELSLLNDTAHQRYLRIFSERPNVLQQVPLKYIASYIGITPQALSRIRKAIT
jgi:CRP-like cAMP-binding protein